MQVKKFIGTKAAILTFFDNFVGVGLGFVLHMLLSRLLGVEGYGRYAIVYSVFIIFTFILTPGLALAVTHYSAISSNPRSILLFAIRVEILVDIILCLFYFLLTDFICRFLSILDLKPYVMMLGNMIIPSGLTVIILSYFKGRLDFVKVLHVSLIVLLTRFIFLLY